MAEELTGRSAECSVCDKPYIRGENSAVTVCSKKCADILAKRLNPGISEDPKSKIMTPEVREFFREAGRRGGTATLQRHGYEYYAWLSSQGGKAASKSRQNKLKKDKSK